jgi:thiamine phosphate synthase YjbQ (UPF0047 family)
MLKLRLAEYPNCFVQGSVAGKLRYPVLEGRLFLGTWSDLVLIAVVVVEVAGVVLAVLEA